jgi:glycosyltransferase involved in cell wall biosynthesis
MAGRIAALLDNDTLHARMSQAARARAESAYRYERMIGEYQSVYATVCGAAVAV